MRRVFQKVKPDKRIIIGYGASFFLLLITYLVTLLAHSKLKQSSELVDHTNNIIFNLERMLSTIKDAEIGVKGYALTRDITFLDPYLNSKQNADSLLKVLLELTSGNRPQQERLKELENVMDKKFRLLNDGVEFYRNGGADTTFNVIKWQNESKISMKRIRLDVAIMQNEERNSLAKSDSALQSIFSSIKTITLTSLLITVLLVAIGFITYTKENKGRKTAMQNIKEYQGQLSTRIDELRSANDQLVQMRSMEKFAATGRIARTIAHEVRNPLTNINLATNQLKTDLPDADESMQHLFGIISRNSERINKLISDLLQSTKFSELNFDHASVTSLLDEALVMAHDRIELNTVTVERQYGDPCNLYVDKEKIKIAFLNIIINAIEAMEPGKGILKITTRTEGKKCVISIADNGSGMDSTALEKLFEPYFTTKADGNGLGLANTQNIIFNHKGTINVSSTPGKGTQFNIGLNNV